MRNSKYLLFLCGIMPMLCWMCSTRGAYDDDYDVYLLIGQSNMAGRGYMEDCDTMAIDGAWLLDDKGGIEPASNPLNRYSSIRKGMKYQRIGPGYGFAQELSRHGYNKILLVVNARGGSSISEWMPGNDSTQYYEEAVRRCREAQKYGRLKAILWHQGESDSDDPEGYLDSLSVMVSHIRTEIGETNVPFIAGEIGRWHRNADKFNPVIRQVSSVIPLSDYVSSEGLSFLINEQDPHFSREGQLVLGKRYAEKILESVSGK